VRLALGPFLSYSKEWDWILKNLLAVKSCPDSSKNLIILK
jgi:hypothetical protein